MGKFDIHCQAGQLKNSLCRKTTQKKKQKKVVKTTKKISYFFCTSFLNCKMTLKTPKTNFNRVKLSFHGLI